jgi:hypothetical protein
MKRRQLVRRAATIGAGSVSGCIGNSAPRGSEGASEQEEKQEQEPDECESATAAGPGSLYDSVTLYRVPEYVEEYSESVVVGYDELDEPSRNAVERALSADDTYKECTLGTDQTNVKSFAAHIEGRREAVGREAFQHTYLHYRGTYYAIRLVQEGDFIRVDSVPCTGEECPTTPTPPP